MVKKIIICLLLLLTAAFFGYKYIYADHRDVSSEEPVYELTVADLDKDFDTDSESASTRYANKAILLSGKVTAIDLATKSITLDSTISILVDDVSKLQVGEYIKVKGRFLGYDDLLDEYKIDQATIVP